MENNFVFLLSFKLELIELYLLANFPFFRCQNALESRVQCTTVDTDTKKERIKTN